MGRPPNPLGTAGKVRTYETPAGWKARTHYRDWDGHRRELERAGGTEAAARRALSAAVRDRLRPTDSEDLSADSRVSVLAEAWYKELLGRDLSPGTFEAYRGALDRYVLVGLGQLRVRELTAGPVDRFLSKINDKHGASSAKMCRSVVSGFCGHAIRLDLLVHNPARDAAPISRATKRAPIALEIEKIKQLRAFLTYDDWAIEHDLLDLIDFMLASGLRIGEAIGVTWDALDLELGTVEVRATVVRVKGTGLWLKPKPKTRAGYRTLFLPSWCIKSLKDRQKTATTDMVFPSPRGHLRDPKNTNRDLRRTYNQAGFDEITSHVFRKSVATLMDEAGLSARNAADQLGHVQVSMTSDKYFGRKAVNTGAAAVLQAIGE